MEIKFLKLIKTIKEEGSLVNSSEKLFLTQSALSHQLKELESQIGFKVFIRSRNNWQLTQEGKEIYKVACEVLNSLEKGFQTIDNLKKGSAGKIRVSTECYSFYQDLPRFIQKMAILYPEIEVDLILGATHHPIEKLKSEEIEIAIVTSKPQDDTLESIAVYEDEIFCLVHQENPLSKLDYIEAKHFEKEQLLIHSYPLDTVSVYEQFLKPNGIHPSKISAIPLTEVALAMVNANMGLMCMPKWALNSFMISNEIQFKRLGEKGMKRNHFLVYRKSDSDKKFINDFVLNFGEHCSANYLKNH